MASKSVPVPSIVGVGKPARFGVSITPSNIITRSPVIDRLRFVPGGRFDSRPCTREAQGGAGRTVANWPEGKGHRKVKGQTYASKTPKV